ncbi:flagellar protein FlgN [Alkalithermobacter paradoxus]|uniref:FlgN protein n=1 Tax=Alkalithermobacter paradoxus TaxID=29349 RepID=A0A1V4I8U9_9FIRM|nr:FlgN protein [[Clostridium] thermoalcaliphilum]
MHSIDQFIEILNEQIILNEKLRDLSKEKKEAIINNDTKKLNHIASQEQGLVKKVITFEKLRGAVISNIERDLNVDKVTSITEIVDKIDSDKANIIKEKGDKLRSILSELKDINDLNNKLLELSIEYLELNFNLLTSQPKPKNYSKKANESSASTNFFDAKY